VRFEPANSISRADEQTRTLNDRAGLSSEGGRRGERGEKVKKALRFALLLAILLLYACVAPFGYGAFSLLSCIPARDPLRRARRLQAIMRRAFRLMHDLLRWSALLDFNSRELAGELPAGAVVLVANHPGLLDVTALLGALPDVTTAVKPALYRRRWWRPLLDGARFFEGAADALDTAHVVAAAGERIREGFRVLIFPEGTRSPAAGLHPFGRTAFEVACRADVPVVPLLIEYTPVWLGKSQPVFALPDQTPRMRITALPAVWPADHGRSSRRLRDVVAEDLRIRLGITGTQSAGLRHGNDPRITDHRDRRVGGLARIPTEEAHRGSADPGGPQARGHRD
jgi:1-acyl-sn-glycerol-3-phosphate acyltransferase